VTEQDQKGNKAGDKTTRRWISRWCIFIYSKLIKTQANLKW